ncbi:MULTISPECIES: restriction endonuclease subunit S [Corynebacterium]|uniref:restriction endonuclease subunit S n=1 Tax=Corynebacterium TaxID=1716 RepID=UPI00257DA454|nr:MULTISPECIES: restriction endonuclease subunit S [Corynebacterium]
MSQSGKWPMVRLGDVSSVTSGGTPKVSVAKYWNGSIPWVTPADLGELSEFDVSGGARFITIEGLRHSSAVLIPAGSVIISSRAPIGHVAISSRDLATNQGCKSFIPGENLNGRFLAHYLVFIRKQLQSMGTGATFKELSLTRSKEILVPLPPLAEQEWIAGILDTSAATIQKNESLRNSIVPSAIDVLAKYLSNSRSVIGDYVESISSGKSIAESTDANSNSRILKVSAVTSGIFQPKEAKPLPVSYSPPAHHQVHDGDVLVSRANTAELLGAGAIVEGEFKGLYLPDKIWRVTPKHLVDPYLLWGILQTPAVRKRISQRSSGSSGSMKNISQKNFLGVPVPELNADQAQSCTALIREALHARRQVTNRQVLLEQLHHSLSTRAFAGDL